MKLDLFFEVYYYNYFFSIHILVYFGLFWFISVYFGLLTKLRQPRETKSQGVEILRSGCHVY